MTADRASIPDRLPFPAKLAYGAGDAGPALTANLLVFLQLAFLTDVAGLPAGLAGSVLMVSKIGDAINDPIIGVMSDRTRSRWGRRYSWMLWGAIPFGIFFFLQWLVPPGNTWLLYGYYVVLGLLFNQWGVTVPSPIFRAVDLMADAAVPGMLVLLGVQLHAAPLNEGQTVIWRSAALRLVLAPLLAWGLCLILGIDGVERSVLILQAAMPTAVMSAVLATEFDAAPQLVAAVIFVTTLLSMGTLSVVLGFLL